MGAPMRTALVVATAVIFIALAGPAQAANFGTHAGLADDLWGDPYFRAGALLADVDHFLPPGEPQTDSLAFALGIVQRAWPLSRNAWRFATGWYEHLDQDRRFADARGRIVAAYPAYTDTDVRLAFDYWTLQKHPFPADYDWISADDEVLGLIQGGLVATDLAGVRTAVRDLLHSTDLTNPGLALQLDAARAYGAFYPTRVRDMEAEYDRYYALTAAGFVPVLWRLDLILQGMAATVGRYGRDPVLTGLLAAAMDLEANRPAGWMTQEVTTLAAFVDALRSSGLPLRLRLVLGARALGIISYLS